MKLCVLLGFARPYSVSCRGRARGLCIGEGHCAAGGTSQSVVIKEFQRGGIEDCPQEDMIPSDKLTWAALYDLLHLRDPASDKTYCPRPDRSACPE